MKIDNKNNLFLCKVEEWVEILSYFLAFFIEKNSFGGEILFFIIFLKRSQMPIHKNKQICRKGHGFFCWYKKV